MGFSYHETISLEQNRNQIEPKAYSLRLVTLGPKVLICFGLHVERIKTFVTQLHSAPGLSPQTRTGFLPDQPGAVYHIAVPGQVR